MIAIRLNLIYLSRRENRLNLDLWISTIERKMKNRKISAAKDLDLRILEKLKRIGMGKLCVINKKAIKNVYLQIGNKILQCTLELCYIMHFKVQIISKQIMFVNILVAMTPK